MYKQFPIDLPLECVDKAEVVCVKGRPTSILLSTRCDVCGSEVEKVELTYDDICILKEYMEIRRVQPDKENPK